MNATRTILPRLTVLLGAVLFVGAVGMLAPGETAAGATFSTKGLNLKIDSKGWYNGAIVPSATWSLKDLVPGVDKFFNFGDIKPGDSGCEVISIHPQNNDAWACLDFTNPTNNDNGQTEPEALVDPNGNVSGELGAALKFFGWFDDGDGKFEPPKEMILFGPNSANNLFGSTTYAVADAAHGSAIIHDKTTYVGMCWCAGNFVFNTHTGAHTCDGSVLGNAAQTDSFMVDVRIRAEAASLNSSFVCSDTSITQHGNNGVGNGVEPPPPGIGNEGNDASGTGPGSPGGSDTAPGHNS